MRSDQDTFKKALPLLRAVFTSDTVALDKDTINISGDGFWGTLSLWQFLLRYEVLQGEYIFGMGDIDEISITGCNLDNLITVALNKYNLKDNHNINTANEDAFMEAYRIPKQEPAKSENPSSGFISLDLGDHSALVPSAIWTAYWNRRGKSSPDIWGIPTTDQIREDIKANPNDYSTCTNNSNAP